MQIVVPETRNQKFSCAVNDPGIVWWFLFRACDRDDLFSLDDHRGIFSRWMIGSVNDRGIYDRNLVLRKDGIKGRRSKKQRQEELSHSVSGIRGFKVGSSLASKMPGLA
jgi:hypothetical protein